MSKKTTHKTKAEKQHLDSVAAFGSIVCRNLEPGDTPAEIHHCSSGTGLSVRAGHFHCMPLCLIRHRSGGYCVAIHEGRKSWERNFGIKLELLEEVNAELGLVAI
ncbi:phage protein [Buttiauxella ferragutiae ATCC 51602]|uniref:Phage protein n=1 Tax=Buttiauxella ferragutiae ATCC 51602 TaxID=1354252 RepID=A0ABX2W710_9ENTR|nr:hypothetical protein [Buttiauxella ferragutiae]OAT26706.1 phage protein [Buttiauxella ferragutiae ATCC 51602]